MFDFISNFTQQAKSTTFFTPLNNPRQLENKKPDIPTIATTSGFIPQNVPKPNRDGANSAIAENHAKREEGLRTAIRSSLETDDDGIPLENKVAAAELALEAGMPAQTYGQLVKEGNYSDKPDSDIDLTIDRKVIADDYKHNVLNNLGEDPELSTFDEIINKGDSIYNELIAGISSAVEGTRELLDYLPENSPAYQIVDRVTSLDEASATELATTGLEVQDALFNRLTQEVSSAVEGSASLRDVVEYLSFLPDDEEADIDMENMVKIVFSTDNLEERKQRLGEWDEQFTAKYGEDGYVRAAAFMAKEGVVDATALFLALRNPKMAGKLLADSKDKIMTRITKALGRASVMGVAGTGVQASMDDYLGIESDIPTQLAGRIGGAFVGEGVAKALAATGRGIIGAGNKIINRGEKLSGIGGQRAAAANPEAVAQAVEDVLPSNVSASISLGIRGEAGLAGQIIPKKSLSQSIAESTQSANTQMYRKVSQQAVDSIKRGKQGNLGHIFDLTESEMKVATFNPSIKEEVMLHGVGNRLIGETITKQTEVDNVLNYYFDHGLRKISRRGGELQGDTSFFNWKELFNEPRNFIGDLDDDLFDALLNKDVYQQALTDAQEAAFKGLNKKASGRVLGVRKMAEELSEQDPSFNVNRQWLDMQGLSPDEQDAYWATGKLLDFSSIVAESTMLARAKQRGLKQLADGSLVEVVETLDDGITKVRHIKGGLEQEVDTSAVKEVTRIMGYKKNFVPRRAKGANYLIGILDPSTGEISVPVASRYKGEIQDKLLEMEAEMANSGKVAFFWRNNTDEKSLNFGMGNNSLSIADNLDEAALNKVRAALSDGSQNAMKDIDMENLRLALDTITHGSIASQQVAGSRGAQGLKTVTGDAFEYKPDNEAITQHLMETSAIALRDFRNDAINQFEREFAEVLDPNLNWDQPIRNLQGKSDLVQRAQSVQDFIRRNVFQDTGYGKAIRRGFDAWADRTRNASPTGKAMIDGLAMPIVETLFKQTRDGSAIFRAATSGLVFAGNVGSFITQVAPSAAMILGIKGVTNPTHLMGGWTDMMGAFAIKAGLPEKMANKGSKQALKALRQSGILSKAEISDIANAAYGNTSTLFSKAMFFVQKGEEVNRANIWLTIRREMMDKAAKGQLTSLDGLRVLSKKDIDSTEFSQIVSEKAKQIFLDTTQAGKLKALSGVGSLIGQFTAPVIKTHTMWFAKGLSKREKFGASLGLFSAFGLNAIPFVAAGIYGMDKVGEWATGGEELDDYKIGTAMTNNIGNLLLDKVDDLVGFTDEQKEFFKTATKKGGIAALTGGEVDLYNKMAIGLFITESVEGIGDPLENLPFVSVLTRAAEGADNILDMFDQLQKARDSNIPEQEKTRELRNFMGAVMNEAGNVLPGFGKIADLMNNHPETRKYLNPELENLDDKGFVTRSGKRIATDTQITDSQLLMNMLGIAPQPVVKNREIMQEQFDRVGILKRMRENWMDKYKTAATDQERLRVKREAVQEAAEAERLLMATYQGALSIATGGSDDRFYRAGRLPRQWLNGFLKMDMERIAGGITMSRGE